MSPRRCALLVLMVILLAACAPQAEPAPEITPTSTRTASPTATTDWFPATPTFTPAPTREASPTPNMRPGVEELLLDEDFASNEFWDVSRADSSSAVIDNGRLTLRTELTDGFVMSVRNEVNYRDFYAEITASPSLCEGEDEYGLIVRNNSSGDHYRFTLSCDGRAKVDRVLGGSLSAHELWVENLAIPAVSPSESHLAVWANSSQIRFFVNDALIFSTTDTTIFTGRIGVFIRQDNQGTLSVSFSDLKVWALDGEGI